MRFQTISIHDLDHEIFTEELAKDTVYRSKDGKALAILSKEIGVYLIVTPDEE